jgi:hypothetical protein
VVEKYEGCGTGLVRCLLPRIDTNPVPIASKYMERRLSLVDRQEERLPMVPATDELEKPLDKLLLLAGLAE